ncbi:hypothetical protein [Marinigracilibium pacificum]|uniref:DUF3244 domain-containing protein n=1 Tax=Marinigracilibium pacificum TaxID=2729599 RepID=A0A848IXC3_9BACT|nr:hypothetical protein [Marinigracilibium pacificum]NMM49183.1 hypothetical protein [Marinigracilibium pacificum]
MKKIFLLLILVITSFNSLKSTEINDPEIVGVKIVDQHNDNFSIEVEISSEVSSFTYIVYLNKLPNFTVVEKGNSSNRVLKVSGLLKSEIYIITFEDENGNKFNTDLIKFAL